MAKMRIEPTGKERCFGDDEIIVSKTDLKGHITYANRIFLKVSGYSETELLGRPHNLIRHPAMPRCVFKLLWDTIANGREIFAYVINMAKNGDHYWVFAHVTPSFDDGHRIVGYHSNRRSPKRQSIDAVQGVYEALCAEERKLGDVMQGIVASSNLLNKVLRDKGMTYEEFVFSV